MRLKTTLFTLLFASLLWGLAGCSGGSDKPDLGTVTGTVTMDDKPLSNVVVIFYPDNNGRPSMSGTDEKGDYELKYSSTAQGAIIGQHTIRITTPTEGPPPLGKKEPKDPIPAKYNIKSELTREVKAGKNNFDFDLKSK